MRFLLGLAVSFCLLVFYLTVGGTLIQSSGKTHTSIDCPSLMVNLPAGLSPPAVCLYKKSVVQFLIEQEKSTGGNSAYNYSTECIQYTLASPIRCATPEEIRTAYKK